ncbi:protein kinase domain-containing protein [Tunturiibacter lichenicola]|uniref:protein kinase domain-containing protein n=1 Tax=Tunturiibacter lichenicola TaxID=2051959 RepID=UPI0021B2D9D7|nr:protein kinase [Edaphobacter lichenicola]
MQELSPGTVLDHYKLIRELGRGGMGVVFEALDQKLGRHVAVKVIPEATRDSSAALERFWREAHAASSLNHPGICTIHELNESAETPFIVMELLEGKSLEKLCRGRAMPYPKLLDLGMQVAGALDAAHRKGILHRDIKPANIFVTHSGQAKILDFGLAKLDGGTGSDASTVVGPLTDSGSTVGTVAYMSPEQARGEPLDARSDLFSLGVVLYEMSTGRRPFDGATTAVIFHRILNESPAALTSLNPQLPVEFETIVNKTLEKDRDLRCQFAGELRADLKRLQRRSGSGSGPTAPGTSSPGSSSSAAVPEARRLRRLAVVAACLAVLAAAGFGAWHVWPRTRPFTTLSVSQITNVGTVDRIALSGDGRFLAEVKSDKGQRTLWVRNIATNTDTQILGAFANEYTGIAFSPDGNYLYFVRLTLENTAISALYVMPVFGGTPKQLIYDIDSIVSVSPDGSRFTYLQLTPGNKDQSSEIRIANKDGSENEVVFATKEDAGPPAWSPKDNRIAWIGAIALDKYAIQIFDIASKKLTTVAAPPGISFPGPSLTYTNVVWMPDGKHLLTFYLRPHSDHAQIGIVTLPSGDFHPVTNDVSAYSQLALSADGHTLATVLNNIDSSVAWYKSDGGEPLSTTPLRITPQTIAWASEERLLFTVPHVDIGQIDRATGEVHPFDIGEIVPGDYISACPDGHILFTGVPKGASAPWVFRMDADGDNIVQLVASGVAPSPGCSSDSREVFYFMEESEISKASLWAVPLRGGTPRQILPPTGTQEFAISSDGRLAGLTIFHEQKAHWRVFDTSSGRMVFEVPLEMSDLAGEGSSTMRFSPDNRAAVYSVLRNGGRTLFYQALDGSASHALLEPVQEGIPDFNWSPSGKQLAIVRQKSSSDVVLIKDQQAKGKDKD